MKKTFLTLLMAAAVGAAGLTAAPQKAEAFWWVIPAIVGGAVVGTGVGVAATDAYYAPPRGNVYVAPAGCHIERQNINGYWRNVRICP
jgi:hypothetical protein